MKKFIKKSVFFLSPILLAHIFLFLFYTTNKGDLLRIGYIADFYPNYRNIFKDELNKSIYYSELAETIDYSKYDILIIGDSYSEQGNIGYQNYLAQKSDFRVLNFGMELNSNPIQNLYSLLNGDFFNQTNIRYVVLQSAERDFVRRINYLNTAKIINCETLNELVNKPTIAKNRVNSYKFLSSRVVKFLFLNLFYLFDDNAFFSEVYRTELNSANISGFFSAAKNELLFYYADLDAVKENNDEKKIESLNNILNDLSHKLKSKGIQLIVLPCPDKYDIYHDLIHLFRIFF